MDTDVFTCGVDSAHSFILSIDLWDICIAQGICLRYQPNFSKGPLVSCHAFFTFRPHSESSAKLYHFFVFFYAIIFGVYETTNL